mgnify:CR=1 FL=1
MRRTLFSDFFILFLFITTVPLVLSAQQVDSKLDSKLPWSVRMTESEMIRCPESWQLDFQPKLKWDYCHGLELGAMLDVYDAYGDEKIRDYAIAYADTMVHEDGTITAYKLTDYSLDRINSGKILFRIYEQTKNPKYKKALDLLYSQFEGQPRNADGGFWHKKIYPHQMWLDGIFMASPYLVQYGEVFGDSLVYPDVVNQITLIARKTYDPETGLYYHGWDESREQAWADDETGCSPNFWSRSIGWYAAALVDVLDYMPETVAGRDTILTLVKNLAPVLVKYQDGKSGVWYQVTDQGNRKGNYLESSASALFVYFLSKAINKGYIGEEYKPAVKKAFDGMIKEFIKQEEDGTYTITNCCAVAGLGGDKVYRDGSFEYYVSEPVIENDPKSVGSFILAAIEYEKMNK